MRSAKAKYGIDLGCAVMASFARRVAASLGGGAAATAEVPGGLTADYENASYTDAVFPPPGEEDSQQEAPAAN